MRKHARSISLIFITCLLLTMSGCYSGNIEQYFSRPQPADEYLQLQELIDKEIAAGSEYAAPTGGSYRQSVQLYDLNSDGTDEALAFFRDAEQLLKINIYAVHGRDYRPVLTLQGEGTSIGSIEYADMNGDGLPELLAAWQIGSGMRMLSVYDLGGWGGNVLYTADCAEFLVHDMDQNSRSELVVLRQNSTGAYAAEMVRFERNSEPAVLSTGLSTDITTLQRVRTVTLENNFPALLVESGCDNGDLVTDLVVFRGGALVNLTCDPATGVSDTRRSYNVYASDIDGDYCIEIPSPNQLYSQTEGSTFWSVTWQGYTTDGRISKDLITYHCFSDGWYLVLPDGWEAGLTVRREDSVSGERSVVISRLNTDGSIHDLLVIYTLTGENRSDRSRISGRFVISEEESTIYAAKILGGVTEDEVKESFHIIYSEWSTGSV